MQRLASSSLVLALALAGCPGPSDPADAHVAPDAALAMDAPSADDAFAPGDDAPATGDDAFTPGDAPAVADAFTASDAPAAQDAPATAGDACVRPMVDLTGLGADCARDADCPVGMQCLSFAGFVLDLFCGIPCEAADGGECACPAELTCRTRADKAGEHRECMR
jgi:hypothetical protein